MKYLWKNGRINRVEYALATVILGILFYIIIIYWNVIPYRYVIAAFLLILFLFQSVKRHHDFNESCFNRYFWFVIPLYNIFVFIELLTRAGDQLENKYGKPSNFSVFKGLNRLRPKKNSFNQTKSIEINNNAPPNNENVSNANDITLLEEKIIITPTEKENFTNIHLYCNSGIAGLQWLVEEGHFVNIGDDILELKSCDYFANGTLNMKIKSPVSGYIHRFDKIMSFKESKYDYDICGIYKNDPQRQNFVYKIFHEIVYDKFTQQKTISWKNIQLSNYLSFRLENVEGNDFICFEYSHPELKLMYEDYILFLLNNDEVITFPINNGRYKVSNYKKGYRLPIYTEEIEALSRHEITSFRIHLKQENHNIDFNWSYSSDFPQKDFQYIIKSTFFNFSNIVSLLENYQPLIKLMNSIEVNLANEECYVYLMVDTTNNYHKIGISNKPEYREKTLQSEKPTIELVCHKVFPTRKISESIEKALHESFKSKRLRGEWFNLSEDDVSNIKKTLQ